MMSVPRPAMFVAIVTALGRPAWEMISASRLWCLAFKTACSTPRFSSSAESRSLFSIETVPTSTGSPCRWISRTFARGIVVEPFCPFSSRVISVSLSRVIVPIFQVPSARASVSQR